MPKRVAESLQNDELGAGGKAFLSALFASARARGVCVALHVGEAWPSDVEADRAIAATFGSERRRAEFLTGRRMLRIAASRFSDCAIGAVETNQDRNGKPVIANGFCSVTHTLEAFGAAAARVPVGLDVERQRDIPDPVWQRIGGADHPLGGSRLVEWTATEAVLKSLGIGLAGGGQHVAFGATSQVTTLEPSPFHPGDKLAWTARYRDCSFDGWTHVVGGLTWSLALAHAASGTEQAPSE